MKKFLEDLKKELMNKNISDEEIEDILKDHEELINEALEDGLPESDLISRFGTPKSIADEIDDDLPKDERESKSNDNNEETTFVFETKNDDVKVQLKLTSEDIYIKPSKDDLIHVLIDGDNQKDIIHVSFENDTLDISKQLLNTKKFMDDLSNRDVYIELPSKTKVSSLMIKTVSSDIEIKEVNPQHLNLNAISGDIKINQLIAESIQMHIVSGDVEFLNIYSEKLHTSQVSGDLEVNHSKIEFEFESQTVSGDIEINEVSCEMFNLDSVSGDVEASEFYPNTVRFKSVSGDLDIKNKTKKEIKILSKKTVSGDINIDL